MWAVFHKCSMLFWGPIFSEFWVPPNYGLKIWNGDVFCCLCISDRFLEGNLRCRLDYIEIFFSVFLLRVTDSFGLCQWNAFKNYRDWSSVFVGKFVTSDRLLTIPLSMKSMPDSSSFSWHLLRQSMASSLSDVLVVISTRPDSWPRRYWPGLPRAPSHQPASREINVTRTVGKIGQQKNLLDSCQYLVHAHRLLKDMIWQRNAARCSRLARNLDFCYRV